MPTYNEQFLVKAGASPGLILRGGAHDDEIRCYLRKGESVGSSDLIFCLADAAGDSRLEIQDDNASHRWHCTSDGELYAAYYVGIGTETPETRLHVQNAGEAESRVLVEREADTSPGGSLLLRLDRSGAGVDDDVLGQIVFQGYNDAGTPEQIDYATIVGYSDSVGDGFEAGILRFSTPQDTLSIHGKRAGIGLSGLEVPMVPLHVYDDAEPGRIERKSAETALVHTGARLRHWTSASAGAGLGTRLRFYMEDGEAATCLVEIVSERQGADNQADLAVLLGDGSGPYAPTEKMRLTQEGYLGIGTAPSHGLHLYGTSDATGSMLMVERVQNVSTGPAILLRHSRGAAGQDGDHIGYIRFYGYNDAGSPEEILYAGIIGKIQDAEAEAETGAFSFQDIHAGAYDTPVTVAGQQVAVGLAAPLASLHLYTASDYVEARIETGSSDDTRIWLKSGANSWAVNVLEDLSFFDGSTHLLVGDADNDRIGIGTSAPDEARHIVGSVGIRGTSTAAIRLHDTNLSKTWIMQTFPGGFMFSEGMEYAFLSIGQPSSYAWLPGSGDPPSTMIGDSDKGVLYIYHEDSPYSELDLAPLGLTQEEKTEPFIRFVGTSAEEDLTKCLVAGSDVATATNRVYIKLLIGGSETTGYLKAFSLT